MKLVISLFLLSSILAAVRLGLLLRGLHFPVENGPQSGAETFFCSPASYNLFPLTSLQVEVPFHWTHMHMAALPCSFAGAEHFWLGNREGAAPDTGEQARSLVSQVTMRVPQFWSCLLSHNFCATVQKLFLSSLKMKCKGCKPVVGSYNVIRNAPDFHLDKFLRVVRYTLGLYLSQEWSLDFGAEWYFAFGGGQRKGELG